MIVHWDFNTDLKLIEYDRVSQQVERLRSTIRVNTFIITEIKVNILTQPSVNYLMSWNQEANVIIWKPS